MRATPLITVLGIAFTLRRSGAVRRYLRAVRAIRVAEREFPASVSPQGAPLLGEALEARVRRGLTVQGIVALFAKTGTTELSDSDKVIFLQHLEPIAHIYTPAIVEDIRAEIMSLVPNDISSL